MSYLVNEAFIEDIVLYQGKKKFYYSSEVVVNDTECMLELKTNTKVTVDNETSEMEVKFKIKHSKIWFKERKWFTRPQVLYVPALIIHVEFGDTEVEYLDRVLLNDHIGFGVDIRDLLFGSSKSKYKLVFNGLNAALERCKNDKERLVNFTLDDKITDYAVRGFLEEALKLRDKIGNFDFEEVA